MPSPELLVRTLGRVEYRPTWQAMQAFTANRNSATPDEIWLVEHPPVFTLGLAGKAEHLLHETSIPVVNIDRGGQITYHGPGQIVVYPLLDLRRRQIKVRELVHLYEQSLIDCLASYGVCAERQDGAPGVYVAGAKVAALGLRIKNGCSYHGLALNVDMDLSPFDTINPCGYPGMAVTQLSALTSESVTPDNVSQRLLAHLTQLLESTA